MYFFSMFRADMVLLQQHGGFTRKRVYWMAGVPYIHPEDTRVFAELTKGGVIAEVTTMKWRPLSPRMALFFEDGMPRP